MDPKTVRFARWMKRNPTGLEVELAALLRSMGITFKAQEPMWGYIPDFYVPAANLIIEADGPHHAGREALDAIRDMRLRAHGHSILHITWDQMRYAPDLVRRDIQKAVGTPIANSNRRCPDCTPTQECLVHASRRRGAL